MKILVTGAGGFIGQRVVRELVNQGTIAVNGSRKAIKTIFACDIAAEAVDKLASEFTIVEPLVGDLTAAETQDAIRQISPDVIVHLAAVVSSAAEADFELGIRINVDALVALINCCRTRPQPPVFVFSSSLAVFSCSNNEVIDQDRPPMPLSSYGSQKVIGEYLVRDASRKNFLFGRSIRFPTISVRPGKPNSAASSFASGIIREPISGEEARLPVPRSTQLYLASPDMAVNSVLHAIGLEQDAIGNQTTITLPGLSISVEAMIERLSAIVGPDAAALVKDDPDPKIEAIVGTWPGGITTPRAEALGFRSDASFDELIRAYIKSTC